MRWTPILACLLVSLPLASLSAAASPLPLPPSYPADPEPRQGNFILAVGQSQDFVLHVHNVAYVRFFLLIKPGSLSTGLHVEGAGCPDYTAVVTPQTAKVVRYDWTCGQVHEGAYTITVSQDYGAVQGHLGAYGGRLMDS